MGVLMLCWLAARRAIAYYQRRNRAARPSRQKPGNQPTPRARKKPRRPRRRKRPRQSFDEVLQSEGIEVKRVGPRAPNLNAEEEPEPPDYRKDPEFKKRFGPRGVLQCKATDRDDQ